MVFGGVGAGLYGMLVFVVLAVFIAGLMVGRTPEYLGKKIEAYDVQVAVLAILVPICYLLGFAAVARSPAVGRQGLNNAGPHGFSEILYAFASAIHNNGSAFAGLTANTAFYNLTLGLAMLVGRFLLIVAGPGPCRESGREEDGPRSAGSFPASGVTFTLLLIGTVLIVGALTFFPGRQPGPDCRTLPDVRSADRFLRSRHEHTNRDQPFLPK